MMMGDDVIQPLRKIIRTAPDGDQFSIAVWTSYLLIGKEFYGRLRRLGVSKEVLARVLRELNRQFGITGKGGALYSRHFVERYKRKGKLGEAEFLR
jgi:hypothetical protein